MTSPGKRRQWLINNMRRAVSACEKRGVDDFLQAWDGAALLDEDTATGLLKDVASSIVARESEAVGMAAAEFYDELRALEVEADGFMAEPVSADFGRVQEAAENLLTRYAESEEARRIVFNALKNAISGWIANAEKETIAENAKRDKKKALYAACMIIVRVSPFLHGMRRSTCGAKASVPNIGRITIIRQSAG